jgi:hypothetical protein
LGSTPDLGDAEIGRDHVGQGGCELRPGRSGGASPGGGFDALVAQVLAIPDAEAAATRLLDELEDAGCVAGATGPLQ